MAVFIFILNKLAFKWYKVPTMLLEKVSIHTEILFVHCYKFFLLLLVLFLCFLKIVYYCLWGINEFVVFLCIVHVWFWFFILLPRFLLLVIKGQFSPRTDVYIGTHQSTRTCQKTCLSVFPYIFQAKYIRNKKINENKLVGGTTTWGTPYGVLSTSTCE